MIEIKGASIDIDGTLLDTEGFQYFAWKDTIYQTISGGHQLSEADYIANFCGGSTNDLAKYAKETFDIGVSVQEIIEMRERLVLKKVREGDCNQLPGAAKFLEYWAKIVPTVLVTGAGTEESNIKLEKSGLIKLVDAHQIPMVSKDDVTWGKPHPESYQKGAAKIGVNPYNCVAFEDTWAGIVSASRVGCICFLVPNRWTRDKIPTGIIVYNSLADAKRAVEKNYLIQPRA